ncbi:MAG: oligosaccharide flippase family protein [Leptolyngbyaceae cyanobacterium SL_5_9]|nr:oligosaccharide flippase family protein [Leptolyngbyaceae cyanobacterium SL_5_9]
MRQIQPLTLRHNFSWTFLGNVVYAACQWGIVVILAKLGTPEMVGQFTLGFAITAPVILLTNLQLRTVQVTDAKQSYGFNDYLGLRLITTSIALLVILGVVCVVNYRWETTLIILLVALAKAVESFSDVLYGLLQQHERMDRIAISMMIKGVLSILLLSAGLYFTGTIIGGVIGLLVAWTIVLVGYDSCNGLMLLHYLQGNTLPLSAKNFHLKAVMWPRWHLKTLLRLLWLSLPLGFVMMLISLNTDIPRYFIERQLGERELGIFAAIAYLMVIGNMLVNALAEAANTRLARYYAEGKRHEFQALLFKLMGIGAGLGIVALLVALVAGKPILAIIYQPEYAQYSDLLVWLMVAAGIGYIASFLGYSMSAVRYFRVQIPLFIGVTGASALSCIWLIPLLGLKGAAIALIIGAIVRLSISSGVVFHAIYKLRKQTQASIESSVIS